MLADVIPAATMPRCCGWLPEHCYAISAVLLVVVRALLECTVWVLTSSNQSPSLLEILVFIYVPGSFNYVSLSDLFFLFFPISLSIVSLILK